MPVVRSGLMQVAALGAFGVYDYSEQLESDPIDPSVSERQFTVAAVIGAGNMINIDGKYEYCLGVQYRVGPEDVRDFMRYGWPLAEWLPARQVGQFLFIVSVGRPL